MAGIITSVHKRNKYYDSYIVSSHSTLSFGPKLAHFKVVVDRGGRTKSALLIMYFLFNIKSNDTWVGQCLSFLP